MPNTTARFLRRNNPLEAKANAERFASKDISKVDAPQFRRSLENLQLVEVTERGRHTAIGKFAVAFSVAVRLCPN
jgi:hypothetical protein